MAVEVHCHLNRRVTELLFDVQHRLTREEQEAGVGVAQVVDANRPHARLREQPTPDLVAVLTVPLAAEAQQPQKLYRIGILDRTSTAINAANLDASRQGLRELGYVEGKTFAIEYRSVDGRDERYPHLAAELVRLKVDLILTRGTPAARQPLAPGRECHRAKRRCNGAIRETGRTAQGIGSGSRTNRGPVQYE
jgi:hypothetical protein